MSTVIARPMVLVRVWAIVALLAASAVAAGSARADAEINRPPPRLTHSPWSKYCLKNGDERLGCYIGIDAWRACSPSGGGIALVEQETETSPRFAILLDVATRGVPWSRGRAAVDQHIVAEIPHLNCSAGHCRGRVEASPDVLDRFRSGATITIEAESEGQRASLLFSLNGFVAAYNGPAKSTRVIIENSTPEQYAAHLKQDQQRIERNRLACEAEQSGR